MASHTSATLYQAAMDAYDLNIQKFIKSYTGIEFANMMLQQRYPVKVSEDVLTFSNGTRPEKVYVYNYDMIRARGASSIENEARALILDGAANIVSMSFQRFFNINEYHAAKISWPGSRAEKKPDGTFIVLYIHKGEVFIQTRSSATASGATIAGMDSSYGEAVKRVLIKKFGDKWWIPFKNFGEQHKFCWAFEYVGPNNPHITPYDEEDLYLLAIFNKLFCTEASLGFVNSFADKFGLRRPDIYPIDSEKKAFGLLEDLHPLDEGFVIVDEHRRRVKIKNPSYLAVDRATLSGRQLSPRHFAHMVLSGGAGEIASYFKEYEDLLTLMERVLKDKLDEVDALWKKYRDVSSKKEFAMLLSGHPLSHILFTLWNGKIGCFKDALKLIKPDYLVATTRSRYEKLFEKAYKKAIMAQRYSAD